MTNNRLIVVQGHDHPALLAPRLSALDSHWISGTAPILNHAYAAKTRYRQADAPAISHNSRIAVVKSHSTKRNGQSPPDSRW